LIEDFQQTIYKRIPFNFDLGPFYKGFPWEKKISKEILCKFFLKFQTWIGFFSTFFEQNQKTRKFRTFIYLIPQVCQVSVKLKNFFFYHPPPPSTIHHPSVTIISTIGKSIFSLLLDLKSKNSIEGPIEKQFG